jgi:hypothetical protein
VPRFGVDGAIYAGALAYAAIDVLCVIALQGPLSGSALARLLMSLLVSLAVGAGLAGAFAAHGFSAWPQAAASIAGFIAIGGLAYRYRHSSS